MIGEIDISSRITKCTLGLVTAAVAVTGLGACSDDEDPAADGTPSTSATTTATTSDPSGTTSLPGASAPGPTAPGSASAPPSGSTPPATVGVPPAPPKVTPTADPLGVPTQPADGSQVSVLETLPGDETGACVDADGQSDVRSGGIAAGSFDEATAAFSSGHSDGAVPLHWIPAHGADLERLTVRATQITGGAATFVHEQDEVSELFGDAGHWFYFLTDFEVPAPGRWRFEATSGPDTGCFIVTFG